MPTKTPTDDTLENVAPIADDADTERDLDLDENDARAMLEDDLVPLGEFAAGLVDLDPVIADESHAFFIEKLVIEQPIELDVSVSDDGSVEVEAAPPTQRMDTSVLPVFHKLKLTYVGEPKSE